MDKLKTAFNGLLYALYIAFIGLLMSDTGSHSFFMMVGTVVLIVAPAFASQRAARKSAEKEPRPACRTCGSVRY